MDLRYTTVNKSSFSVIPARISQLADLLRIFATKKTIAR